jgi:hypothetical protein
MDTPNDRVVRYLGAAFLAVFITSLAAALLSGQVFSGSISAVLANVSENAAAIRASNVFQLLTSIGIIALAALLYVVLREANPALALVGFGWWLAEGVMLAASALGTYGLLRLSSASTVPTTSAPTGEALGTLFLGIQQDAFTVHMLFFCLGGLIWYGLMITSRLVPRWLATWGLVGVGMLLASMLVTAWDRDLDLGVFGIAAMVVYAPFEPVIGTWLLARGAGYRTVQPAQLRGNPV